MCVMLVNKAKHISYLFLDLRVFLCFLWNLFFQMCGDLPKPPLVGSSTMSHLSMIIVNLCGFILSRENVMCLMFFVTSLLMLNAFYLARFYVSCPHTHQQNGSAERKHLHIVDMGFSLLSHASMPFRFWDEAYLLSLIHI